MKKHFVVGLILAITFFTLACNNEDGEVAPNLSIGDFHQGGVVFYLDATKSHGLVSAVLDQSFDAVWGCSPLVINGADDTAIGTGAQNTIDILATCSTAGIAADLCNQFESNGFNDWFLPSKDELNELYKNREKVNETSLANNGSVLEGTEYWSSSHQNSNTVWIQSFNAGNQSGMSEDDMNNVRAIRAF